MLLAPAGAGNTLNLPDLVGDFPKSSGQVTIVNETPGRITYFPGLQRVPDPSRANITTTDNLRNSSNLFAIADADNNCFDRTGGRCDRYDGTTGSRTGRSG
jgi:hypothetical protein